jgi:alpha-L-arabinofuranosidase
MKLLPCALLAVLLAAVSVNGQDSSTGASRITIYPEKVLNEFSGSAPIGINVNYFEDNDSVPRAPRTTAAALMEMGMKYLRYPGGAKSDYYFFSAPPFERSIPTMEQSGPGSNASRAEFFNADRTNYLKPPLDFDHFMAMCQEVEAEPVIVCAIDTYIMTPDKLPGSTGATKTSSRADYLRNAVEWVRYANVKHHYHVKYWVLGNETETCYFTDKQGKPYGYTPEQYAQDIVEFSAAMKAVDPSIKIVSNGAPWVVKRYLNKAGVAGAIDCIATSNYPLSATKYASYDDCVHRRCNHGDLVTTMEDVLKEIDHCPGMSDEKKQSIKVITTEFSSSTWWEHTWPSGQDLGHAMFNFDIAGQLLSNPRILFACFWNTRYHAHDNGSAYNALSDTNALLPLGQSIALWGNYCFPKMIATSQADGTVSYASLSADNRRLYLYVINQMPDAKVIRVEVSGRSISQMIRVAEMSGTDIRSDKTALVLHERTQEPGSSVRLNPYSVTVFEAGLQGGGRQ